MKAELQLEALDALLRESVKRSLAAEEGSHAALLHAQLTDGGHGGENPAPLLCLAAAEALGSEAEAALPAATALFFLGEMGRVFRDVAEGGGLAGPWGMPRALNAGDAFFALAQAALLADASADAERQLRALARLDEAARGLCAELVGESAAGRALVVAALGLAGIVAGLSEEALAAVEGYAAGLAAGAPDESRLAVLPPEVRRRLAEAAKTVTGGLA